MPKQEERVLRLACTFLGRKDAPSIVGRASLQNRSCIKVDKVRNTLPLPFVPRFLFYPPFSLQVVN